MIIKAVPNLCSCSKVKSDLFVPAPWILFMRYDLKGKDCALTNVTQATMINCDNVKTVLIVQNFMKNGIIAGAPKQTVPTTFIIVPPS